MKDNAQMAYSGDFKTERFFSTGLFKWMRLPLYRNGYDLGAARAARLLQGLGLLFVHAPLDGSELGVFFNDFEVRVAAVFEDRRTRSG
jgi:hypothetical protein